jgi:hypothetical protein
MTKLESLFFWGGVRLSPLGTSATQWLIIRTPDNRWVWGSRWNENWQEKLKYSEKTCPSANLSTTNPTWHNLGSNPGRCGGKPATNRQRYGTAELENLHTLQSKAENKKSLSFFSTLTYIFIAWNSRTRKTLNYLYVQTFRRLDVCLNLCMFSLKCTNLFCRCYSCVISYHPSMERSPIFVF